MAVKSLYREPEAEAQVEWPILEMHDVFKIYRSGPVETVALRGVDMVARAGDLVAILGPSGCGKSTLLALAAGLDRASAGDVRSAGVSLLTSSEDELAAYRARSVGIIFQSGNLWPTLSARENVLAALRLAVLKNYKVINMSLACPARFAPELMQLCERAHYRGLVVVAARRNVPMCRAMLQAHVSTPPTGSYSYTFWSLYQVAHLFVTPAGIEIRNWF